MTREQIRSALQHERQHDVYPVRYPDAARAAQPLVPMNEPAMGIGPSRPAIIAQREWCPSCDAAPGEACRLTARALQGYSHEARHKVAQRAAWRELHRWARYNGVGPISYVG